jgi:Flp pilus assembly protein CpaB
MSYSVRNIAIALVLAALAAMLVVVYTGNVKKQADARQTTTPVLVATQDIQPGTTVADAIQKGLFQVRPVVQRDAIPGALDSEKRLNPNQAAATTIPANAQVTATMFRDGIENPIAQQISGADRAVQISLNENMVLNGTLAAGDHVDILGTYAAGNGGISRVILSDVKVLSVQQTGAAAEALAADSAKGGSADGTSGAAVILAVPKSEEPKINYTLAFGKHLWFLLRPQGGDTTGGLVPFADFESTVLDGLNAAQKKQIQKLMETAQ